MELAEQFSPLSLQPYLYSTTAFQQPLWCQACHPMPSKSVVTAGLPAGTAIGSCLRIDPRSCFGSTRLEQVHLGIVTHIVFFAKLFFCSLEAGTTRQAVFDKGIYDFLVGFVAAYRNLGQLSAPASCLLPPVTWSPLTNQIFFPPIPIIYPL